jgi:undecaprenyl-diphosphatase
LVQLGTLLAVIIYFRKDLYNIILAVINGLIRRKPLAEPEARLGWLLVAASIPAIIAGILFKGLVERAFGSPLAAGLFLLGTAVMLVVAERIGKRQRKIDSLTWLDAVIVGVFQAISLFPGISRSGATISGGMIRQFDRPTAARFSFLMSVPVMIGAGGLALVDLFKSPSFGGQISTLVVGFLAAAIVGYLAIHWLLAYLARRSLYLFAIYCLLLSVFVIIFSVIRT